MDLEFKLDGSTVKCRLGFGVMIAATEYLKEKRKREYRESRDLLAECGSSTPELQAEIVRITAEFLKNQTPSAEDVSDWLQTLDGIRFFMEYGTKNGPKKLNAETIERVLDQMPEEEFKKLIYAISELCLGSENSRNMRQLAQQKLDLERSRQEQMLEVAQMELDVIASVRDKMAEKLAAGGVEAITGSGATNE